MMRIIEVELKNHIVIGDVHLKTNNEINSFIGVNGSGKSILLSTLQPFGTSDRYSMAYPIIAEHPGYKKIVYQIDNIIYETIHEYTPNKQKHSCKSYLNMIKDGIKTELNPNGHVNLYEELVEKHLHFSRDVLDICYITSRADGLTSATPKRRKEILETTNMSSLFLKDYQKIVSELLKDKKAMLRVLSDRRLDLLNNHKSESILEDEIQRKEKYLIEVENQLKINTDKKIKLMAELEGLEKLSLTDEDMKLIDIIKRICGILKEESLFNIKDKYINCKYQLDNSFNKLKQLEENKSNLQIQIDKQKEFEYLIAQKKEYETIYTKISSQLIKLINNIDDTTQFTEDIKTFGNYILPTIEKIKTLNPEFQIELSRDSINSMIERKTNQVNELHEFITTYHIKLKESQSNANFNINDIQVKDNCNTCPLYNKFVLAKDYLSENKVKYDDGLYIKLQLEEEIQFLEKIKTLEETYETVLENILNRLTDQGKLRLGFNKSIIEMYKNDKQYNDIIKYLLENCETIYNAKQALSAIDIKLEANQLLDSQQLLLDIQKIDIEISQIKDNNLKLIEFIKQYDTMNISSLFEIKNDIIKKDLIEIDDLYEKNINKYKYIKNLESEILRVDNDIKMISENRDNVKNDIMMMKNNIQEIRKTLTSLLKINESTDYLKNIKGILEKDIPILLLQSHLEYIQIQTNQILEDNNIDIQIEIKSTGTDIIIPAYINGRINPDIRNVSQGESCLISLLINACMCHLLGYSILYLDEIDANLDSINRDKFNNIIYSILSHLHIDQIFCISHNISSSVESAQIYALGNNWKDLLFSRTSNIIEINKN